VDRARYERNSPLLYLERVNTPLLIAQGDMDGVPLTEGEQVFTQLYRMGKRARFVRYWGEAHDFTSPANIRHLWNEVGAWFDTHLRDAPGR
jgi:dipeptidyl aminopeptidase/acylaminoacyl peptidase